MGPFVSRRRIVELLEAHAADRAAWAEAHAKERAELLRHAADERAALVNALMAVRAPTTFVSPPWPEQPQSLQVTEEDEIEADRAGLPVEEYLRRVDEQLAVRGFDPAGSEVT